MKLLNNINKHKHFYRLGYWYYREFPFEYTKVYLRCKYCNHIQVNRLKTKWTLEDLENLYNDTTKKRNILRTKRNKIIQDKIK